MTLETAVSSTLSAVQEAHALDGVKNYLRIDGDYDDAMPSPRIITRTGS